MNKIIKKIGIELLGALLGAIVFIILSSIAYNYYPILKILTIMERFWICIIYYISASTWQLISDKLNKR